MTNDLSPDLRAALELVVGYWLLMDLEQWRKKGGNPKDDRGFAEDRRVHQDNWAWWERYCAQFATAFIAQHYRYRTFWPTVASGDIIKAIEDITDSMSATVERLQPKATDGDELGNFRDRARRSGCVDAFYLTFLEKLEKMIGPTKLLSFHLRVWPAVEPNEAWEFCDEYRNSEWTGILSIGMKYELIQPGQQQKQVEDISSEDIGSMMYYMVHTSSSLYLQMKGKTTPKATEAFAASIKNVIQQAAMLACECESLGGEEDEPLYRPYDPGVESDGIFSLAQKSSAVGEERFEVPVVLCGSDVGRFVWLCRRVVFNVGQPVQEGDPLQTMRSFVWRMAECSYLRDAPLAMIGYAGAIEAAFEAILGPPPQRESGERVAKSLWITKSLELSAKAGTRLDKLFAQRNRATHQLSYNADPNDIKKMWRMAKAAGHYLAVALSDGSVGANGKSSGLQPAMPIVDKDRLHRLKERFEQILTQGSSSAK